MASLAMNLPKPSLLISPKDISLQTAIFWLLRVSAALNFIGHGTWSMAHLVSWGNRRGYRFPFAGIGEGPAPVRRRSRREE